MTAGSVLRTYYLKTCNWCHDQSSQHLGPFGWSAKLLQVVSCAHRCPFRTLLKVKHAIVSVPCSMLCRMSRWPGRAQYCHVHIDPDSGMKTVRGVRCIHPDFCAAFPRIRFYIQLPPRWDDGRIPPASSQMGRRTC